MDISRSQNTILVFAWFLSWFGALKKNYSEPWYADTEMCVSFDEWHKCNELEKNQIIGITRGVVFWFFRLLVHGTRINLVMMHRVTPARSTVQSIHCKWSEWYGDIIIINSDWIAISETNLKQYVFNRLSSIELNFSVTTTWNHWK